MVFDISPFTVHEEKPWAGRGSYHGVDCFWARRPEGLPPRSLEQFRAAAEISGGHR